MSVTTHTFTLKFELLDEVPTSEIEERLYTAGCDDALLSMQDDWLDLDFDREGHSLHHALASALDDVQRSGLNVVLRHISAHGLTSSGRTTA